MARILVIDDDRSCGALLTRALVDEGYAVTCVGNPGEAIRVIDTGWADLLIADWALQNHVDGVDLAHHLHAIQPDRPIIFVTGYGRSSLERASRGLQFHSVIEKPIDLDDFLRTVRDALGEGSPVSCA
ncbi:MAG TPA: response regulator [Phycisphaerae bacterium]